jgi:hypothetical protein
MTIKSEIKVWIPPKPTKKPEIKVHIPLHQPKKPKIKVRIRLQPPKKAEFDDLKPPLHLNHRRNQNSGLYYP